MSDDLLDGAFPRAKRPCGRCPWRRDVPPGQFPAERYEALRDTAPSPSGETAALDAPMFACHKSPEGREFACAGWLATQGRDHVRVRWAAATGELPRAALDPGEGWPALFDDYDEMAARQAGD